MTYKAEKDFQKDWTRWLRYGEGAAILSGKWGAGIAYELKLVRMWRKGVAGFRFSDLPEHELLSLVRARGGKCLELYRKVCVGLSRGAGAGSASRERAVALDHKISDSAIGFKPCDGFLISGGAGVLGLCFDFGEYADAWIVGVEDYLALVRARKWRGSVKVEDMEGLGAVYCFRKIKKRGL